MTVFPPPSPLPLPRQPRLLNTRSSNRHFVARNAHYFGGAVSVTPEQYRRANGFSNAFLGWGNEDDDFRYRVEKWVGSPQYNADENGRYLYVLCTMKQEVG